jgi:hypothetical protein
MEKKNVIYFAIVVILTIAALSGLYLYNKGLNHDLNLSLKLDTNLDANLSKIYIKPKDETKNYVILYMDVKNNSNQALSETKGEIALRNGKNQVCTSNRYYSYMRGIDNLAGAMYDRYASGEVKSGYLVFECLKGDNNFTINYGNQNLEIKY